MDESPVSVKHSRDEASKLLGEKMLQGWTMLGISCPVEDCYTPLVRNKQGKTFCVRCGQYVLSEEEAKKQREEQLALQKQQDEAAAAAEAEAEEQERKRRIEQQFRLQEQAKQTLEMQQLEQLAASRAATANGAAKRKIESAATGSSAADDAQLNALRRQTLAALYQKMGALTDSLTPTDHSERLVSIAKAVREIAEAAQLLKQQ